MHEITTLGEETVAGGALLIVACGGASVREGTRVSHGEVGKGRKVGFRERGYTAVDVPHPPTRALTLVSTAAWSSTGGERLAPKADSPVAIVVASVNEHLAGGQVVAVPSQAQLLTFAKCFEADVVAFV